MHELEGQWRPRPWLAGVLRVAIVAVPVLAGAVVARVVAYVLAGWGHRWLTLGALLLVGLLASILTSRLTSRLLPLTALLRMTMIFPDRAPSRVKIARRTTGLADIRTRLTRGDLSQQEAASTMLALVTALGRHDRHTRGHSERVRLFCDLLSDQLGLSPAEAGRLRWAALIHDIGKLQIPVSVLNKPGKLDDREWGLIREHPSAGAELAAPLREWLGPWFAGIAEHHEKYDGSGYPRGLSGQAISPAGRAVAVVDAFETMTASRSYKAARTAIAARAELTRCAGSHFDPVMVRAFLGISLPRLLWSIGPLALVVNLPYVGWLGQGGLQVSSAVSTTATAANVAGMTAVAMTVGVAPVAGHQPASMSSHHRSSADDRTRGPSRPEPAGSSTLRKTSTGSERGGVNGAAPKPAGPGPDGGPAHRPPAPPRPAKPGPVPGPGKAVGPPGAAKNPPGPPAGPAHKPKPTPPPPPAGTHPTKPPAEGHKPPKPPKPPKPAKPPKSRSAPKPESVARPGGAGPHVDKDRGGQARHRRHGGRRHHH